MSMYPRRVLHKGVAREYYRRQNAGNKLGL